MIIPLNRTTSVRFHRLVSTSVPFRDLASRFIAFGGGEHPVVVFLASDGENFFFAAHRARFLQPSLVASPFDELLTSPSAYDSHRGPDSSLIMNGLWHLCADGTWSSHT